MAKRRGRRFKQKGKQLAIMGGRRIPNFLIGATLYSLEKSIVPKFAGPYQGALDKALIGLVPGQRDFLSVGIKEGISVAMDTYLIPRLRQGLGGLLGGNGTKASNGNGSRRIMNVEAYSA